ncbi:MAG: TolC family protein [Candidatus Omnitrophota bacterium]
MYRVFLTVFLFNLIFLGNVCPLSAKENKSGDEERQLEIEKAIFLASSSQSRVLRIGLVDCLLYALKNNHDILIKQVDPQLKADDVKIAQADFEPQFTVDLNVHESTELASSALQGANVYTTHEIDLNSGVSGKLPTGTKYSVDYYNQRYKSDSIYDIFNPAYTVEPTITITQPLFKGFGIAVNKADITIARNNKVISEKSFKDTAINTVSKAKAAYYNYVFSLETYSLDKLSLERTVDLLEIDKARYEKGMVSSVGLLETEAAVAQKEKTLLAAEAAVKKSEDELKLVTNLVSDPEIWNAKVELIDKLQMRQEEADLLQSLKNAFSFRPDYQSMCIDLKSRDVKIMVAKNSLLPTIDLSGSFGMNGLGKDYNNALQKTNINYPDWSAGVNVTIPWGGADRAKYDQRKLEKAQALIALKKLEQEIILDIRDKVREVNVRFRQEQAARISLDKETQNYAAQKERYAAGQVSTHDMLDYQDKLSQAELDHVRAVVDYNLALINLDRSQGLTLVKNNVKLDESLKE